MTSSTASAATSATSSTSISARVASLGLALEAAASPAANYVPFVLDGHLLHISGQVSRKAGKAAFLGRLGDTISDELGTEAARASALGVLSQIAAATGDRLDRVARIVRLRVFVASTPDFDRHSTIANGASDLMVAVFGEAGRHSRSAVGVASLPSGVAIEIEAVVALTAGD
ncbi:RidA family protein [Paraburkholderia sp. D15]|uniref:RidA family protein n=1 Tax=Paraburkholderia sp. D15 TaxID=2880218 RepID=UPI00247A70BF|nr:RidA family protein [Paraburkholderia sp. D15]WGS52607.1 RidA family protein [Paraburkholderia sp. D15]